MRGLISCFAIIVCLSLASGTPSVEESKVYTKNFNYEKKDVIYPMKPFSKDEMVYAVCEGNDDDKKCKVYVESTYRDENTVHSCDLNLNNSVRFDRDVVLCNAGNSRAIFAVRDGHTKIKLISLNLKGCDVKEASVDVPQELTNNELDPLDVIIVPHEKSYDIIYENEELCHVFLCKATFDYEGKLVKAASGFPVRPLLYSILEIDTVNKAYLVGETNGANINVFLLQDGDVKPNTLFTARLASSAVAFSTEENNLAYCAHVEDKVVCKQYDVQGKTMKMEFEFPTGNVLRMESVDVLNLEKGLLTLTVETKTDGSADRNIFIVHFDEHGRNGKSVNVDLKCDKHRVVLPKLYKNSNGQYCVSSICLTRLDGPNKKQDEFSRSTRCFLQSELF